MIVLVIDDNIDAADTLCMLLTALGHSASFCTCGADGISAAMELHPSLIFLDIGMPVMDGFEVAFELRACRELDSCKIVALSAWGDTETVAKAVSSGFDSHLTKPASVEALQLELSLS